MHVVEQLQKLAKDEPHLRFLQQVADQVGLTRERVRQLEKQSLTWLRAPETGERLLDWAG